MSIEITSLLPHLIRLFNAIKEIARKQHQEREAEDIAHAVRFEIASLVNENFGLDAEVIVKEIISQSRVIDAIIAGEPADLLHNVFKQEYENAGDQVTGHLILGERVARFTDQVAGILLRFNLNPIQAIGNRVDAGRQESAEGFKDIREGVSELTSLVADRTDPFQGHRANIQMTQDVLHQGKIEAAMVNTSYLLSHKDFKNLPSELQHHIKSLSSSASMYAGNIGSALESFETLLAEAPENISLMQNTATVNLLAGHFDRSEELAKALLEIDPQDGGAMGVLIQTTYAKHGIQRVRELWCENPWISVKSSATGALTMVLANEGLSEEAENLLRPHIPKQISTFHALQLVTQLGTALASRASEELKRALPRPGHILPKAEKMLQEAEATYSQAIDWLQGTNHSDTLALTLSNRSTVRMLIFDVDGAIHDLKRGLEIEPNNRYLRLNLTRIQFLQLRFAEIIQRIGKTPDTERLAEENGMLGRAYLYAEQFQEAIPLLERELEESSDSSIRTLACISLLTAYAAVNDRVGVERMRTTIESDPDAEPHALASIANVLIAKNEQEDAEVLFKRAVTSQNQRGKEIARANYADYLMENGQWGLAAEQLHVLAASSEDEMIYRNLSLCLLKNNEFTLACDIANTYMRNHSCVTDIAKIRDAACNAQLSTIDLVESPQRS